MIKLGTRWEKTWTKRGVLEVYMEWRDLWVGVYVGPDAIYVCPLPCMVLRFSRGSKRDPMSWFKEAFREAAKFPPIVPPDVPATYTTRPTDDHTDAWRYGMDFNAWRYGMDFGYRWAESEKPTEDGS